MSAVWWWAGRVGHVMGQKELSSGPLPHLLIKRALVCDRAQQTGKGLENKARALPGAMTGLYLNFRHRNKLGEINHTSTFDQTYVQRTRLCTTLSVYTGFSAQVLSTKVFSTEKEVRLNIQNHENQKWEGFLK